MHNVCGKLTLKRKEEEGGQHMPISFLQKEIQLINPVNFLFLPGEESEKVERRECITLPVLPPYGRQPQ